MLLFSSLYYSTLRVMADDLPTPGISWVVVSDGGGAAWRVAGVGTHQRFAQDVQKEESGDEGCRKMEHSCANCIRGD